MPWPVRRSAVRCRRGTLGLFLLLDLATNFGGCSKAPTNPSGNSLVGRWVGTINSQAIGAGAATVVLDSQVGPASAPLLAGTWSFVFSDPAFSTSGPISAGFNASGTVLGLFFDRGVVPCPGEPGGTAQKAIAASMTVTGGSRMRGDYVIGGCPGGTLELEKQ